MKSKNFIGIGVVIVTITLAVYAANVRNGFIRFDDYDYIVLNKHIASGLTPRTVAWSFTAAGYASNWHPLAWISHAADLSLARVVGLDWRGEKNDVGIVTQTSGAFPVLVHLENILWHAANAVLLWLLMVTVAKKSKRSGASEGVGADVGVLAAFFALLWALHPLRVEVVAWASERKELLSVFFMLLTLLAYMRRDEVGRGGLIETVLPEKSTNSIDHLFSPPIHSLIPLVFFILALLAKPVAVSLPAVLFVFDFVLARRTFRESVRRVFPFVAAAACVCVLTMLSQTQGLAGGRDWPWLTRIVCAVEAPAVYLKQTFWPVGLCIDYDLPDWTSWPYFVGGVMVLAAIVGVFFAWLRRPNRWTALGVLAVAWCYVGLLPMIGLVKVGYEPHNDRYTYWIGCGAAFCLFLAVDWLAPKWEKERVGLAKFAVAVLLVLGGLSLDLSLTWKDTTTLFSRAVNITKSAFFAHGLADDLVASEREAGRDKAEQMLRELLTERPTAAAHAAFAFHLAAYCHGANTFSISGEKVSPFIEARISAEQALAAGDGEDLAYAALAFADYREAKYVSAYENMKKAIDRGFKSAIIPVRIEEWKEKADKQLKEGKRDVQG